MTSWEISGQYAETCSCDFLCPCLPGLLMAKPTKGWCAFAMGFHIDRGHYGDQALDDVSFVIVGRTPEEMGKGNWEVGLLVDEGASATQQQALGAITGGQEGGPMAALAGVIGTFHGIEAAAVRVQGSAGSWSVTAGSAVNESMDAANGMGGEPLFLDNTGHPAANRFGLAHAKDSHLHAFGINWDDTSGKNNAQYAPFHWKVG